MIGQEKPDEITALKAFREANEDLFKKDDRELLMHLGIVVFLLSCSTAAVILMPPVWMKILLGLVNSLFWFSLINATIHHHHTHHNAADHAWTRKLMDFLYFVSVPNAPKRLGRYTRAHLNHHARPFHETDVDHHYGLQRYFRMSRRLSTKTLYFLELSFVGAHMPGWEDYRYMNEVPLEKWNQKDYEKVKEDERTKAVRLAFIQWTLFFMVLWIFPPLAWGWAFPMLFVKNWAHFLGQFQHYDERLLDPSRSVWNRTKTYHFPGWLNYLLGGEISGHFLHHLYPELPYYRVETARQRFLRDPELAKRFATY